MSVIDDGALTWNYQGLWGTNAGYGPAWLELVQNLNQRCDFMGVTRPTVVLMQPDPEVDPVSPIGLCSSGQTPVNVRDMLSAMQTALDMLETNGAWCDSDGSDYSGFDLTTLSMTRPNLKAICENIRQSLDEHRYKDDLYDGSVDSDDPGSYLIYLCDVNGNKSGSWQDEDGPGDNWAHGVFPSPPDSSFPWGLGYPTWEHFDVPNESNGAYSGVNANLMVYVGVGFAVIFTRGRNVNAQSGYVKTLEFPTLKAAMIPDSEPWLQPDPPSYVWEFPSLSFTVAQGSGTYNVKQVLIPSEYPLVYGGSELQVAYGPMGI